MRASFFMISRVAMLATKVAARKAKNYTPQVIKATKEGYKMGRYLWMEGGKRLIPVKGK